MKYHSLPFGVLTALCLFLYTMAMAKPGNGTGGFNTIAAFTENKGQIADQYYHSRKDIDFKLQGNDMTMFVGDAQIHYQWYRSNKKEKSKNEKAGLQGDSKSPSGDLGVAVYRMDVVLLGANKNAEVIKEGLQEDYENYYLPQYPDGVTAHRYNKITYKNIYPNIDWEIEASPNPSQGGVLSAKGCKYNFIVHPGGDYRDIKIQYNGATSIALKDGALVANTPIGSITENVPYTYDATMHKEIKSNFILNNNILSYNITLPPGHGDDKTAPALVIDPTISWATYYGDIGVESLFGSVVDHTGNLFMCGTSTSTSNIATTGAYQSTLSGTGINGMVIKFNAAGVRQWATYYSYVTFNTVVVDNNDDIYLAGVANAGASTTPGAYQAACAGMGDCFITKFSSSGNRIWATYYGGTLTETCTGLSVDPNSNLFICGQTSSTSGIATAGSFQSAIGSINDGFISKFSSSGALLWGTYYGGSSDDRLTAVAADNSGNVTASGRTTSATGIATTGSLQQVYGGSGDGLIVQFSASGTRLWATYYGGSQFDETNGIIRDKFNNLYIIGNTYSTNNIATTNSANSLPDSAFLLKMSLSGSRIWGRYIRPSLISTHANNALNVDSAGYIYYGSFLAQQFMNIPCMLLPQVSISLYSVVQMLDSNGYDLWSANCGTSYITEPFSISCGPARDIYICGRVFGTGLFVTPGCHQSYYSNNYDAFVVKFAPEPLVRIAQPFVDTLLCAGDTLNLRYNVTAPFIPGNVFTVQLSNASGSFASPTNIGSIAATTGGFIQCIIPTSAATAKGYRLRIVSSGPATLPCDSGQIIGIGTAAPANLAASANTLLCEGQNLLLLASSTSTGINSYQWSGPNSFSSSTQNPVITGAAIVNTGDYILKAGIYGCYAKDTVSVLVKPLPLKPTASNNGPLCSGSTLNLSSATTTIGVSYSWTGPSSYASGSQYPTVPNVTTSMAGNYVVSATLNGCSTKDTTIVVINSSPIKPLAGNDTLLCSGGSFTLNATSLTPAVSWQWSGPNGFISSIQNPAINSISTVNSGSYIVTATLGACTALDTIHLTILQTPAKPNATSNSPICSGQTLNLFATTTTGGVSWNWVGPGGFNTSAQNPSIPNAQTANAGSYVVTATLGNCSSSDTEVVVINQGPAVNVYPSPNDTICQGGSVTLVALPISAGTGPSLQWYKNSNPIGGATNTSYSTTPNNGDVYYCQMTPGTGTSCTGAINSNSITMTVLPVTTPSVSISGPAGAQNPFNLLTFHATGTGGGSSPTYQWLRSGQLVQGAIADTWSTQGLYLNQHDTICVILTSSDICAAPKSDTACMVVNILTGVEDINKNTTIQLYPNPNDGHFIIDAKGISSKEVTIEITNAVGQTVHTQILNTSKGLLHETISTNYLAAGIYLLKLHDGDAVVTLRLVVSR